MIIATTLLTSCVKLLLMPAYRSTDFEVHRNWLAITHSLPINKWYYEDSSEWTLDYPPFFAWFEYLLSLFAGNFDEEMLKVDNHYYASDKTILFQRLSVIVTDLVFVYGVHRVCDALPKSWKKDVVLPILLISNCGLILVDHIHFQYNGIMYGFLLLSVACIFKESYKWAAFWFAFLLNMKHIYIYLAPAYFVYLLRHYCLTDFSIGTKSLTIVAKKFVELGSIVIAVFSLSFLPFINDFPQVLSRLFPFKRGLCHAYWAPNIWTFYNVADKILPIFFSNNSINAKPVAAMTGGLVQEFSYNVLPNISPPTTMVLTIIFMLPSLGKLLAMPKNSANFLRCLVLCGLTSFLFGWHVHEKAILMAIVPLSILSIVGREDAKYFLLLSTVGHYSLFPLLFPINLLFIKTIIFLLYTAYAFYSLQKVYLSNACKYAFPLLNFSESVYLLGLTGVFLYENLIQKLLGLDAKLPFLPLMLTSVYCTVGMVYSWARFYIYFLRINKSEPSEKKNKTM